VTEPLTFDQEQGRRRHLCALAGWRSDITCALESPMLSRHKFEELLLVIIPRYTHGLLAPLDFLKVEFCLRNFLTYKYENTIIYSNNSV
jgi:hypothetical protein